MFSKKIVLGVSGTMVVLATTLGVASIASAETTTPSPSATASQAYQRGAGYGRADTDGTVRGSGYGRTASEANENAGLRNGMGYGAVALQSELADQLGVSQDAVAAAMQAYHADNASETRGRDLTDEQRDAEHADLAKFLASELKVDEAKVLEILDSHESGTGTGQGWGANR